MIGKPWYLVGGVAGFLAGFWGGEFNAPVAWSFLFIVKLGFGVIFALAGITIVWTADAISSRVRSQVRGSSSVQ